MNLKELSNDDFSKLVKQTMIEFGLKRFPQKPTEKQFWRAIKKEFWVLHDDLHTEVWRRFGVEWRKLYGGKPIFSAPNDKENLKRGGARE